MVERDGVTICNRNDGIVKRSPVFVDLKPEAAAKAGFDHFMLKEISYIHARAYAPGELKHGTLTLIGPGVPVIAVLIDPEIAPKTTSNIMEVKARGGRVVAIGSEECLAKIHLGGDDVGSPSEPQTRCSRQRSR